MGIFYIGSKVRLNSGGPVMTVRKYDTDQYTAKDQMVVCDWFNNNNELKTGTFHETQLTEV